MKQVKVALVGFGVIGRSVAKTIDEKRKFLRDEGIDITPVAICEKDGCVVGDDINLKNALENAGKDMLHKTEGWIEKKSIEVIGETEADIVVELTPSNIKNGEPGYAHMKKALNSGKHVVTSNKGPLALYYTELAKLANDRERELLFEATVGGGMPVFNLIEDALKVNKIKGIRGVLNGTTNYILTKMHEDGVAFDVALQEAKELGYAETDPTYDVENIDAAAKLVILSNSILGTEKRFEDVERYGMGEITAEAVGMAKRKGFSIKVIGEALEDRLEVSPRIIPNAHPLNVTGTLNALQFETDLMKDVTIIGRGAGGPETSSAVLSDVISIARRC